LTSDIHGQRILGLVCSLLSLWVVSELIVQFTIVSALGDFQISSAVPTDLCHQLNRCAFPLVSRSDSKERVFKKYQHSPHSICGLVLLRRRKLFMSPEVPPCFIFSEFCPYPV
jgi:hypothetical protein